MEFFQRVAQGIISRIPNATVVKNKIPQEYLPFDLYNNLVPNDGVESNPWFDQVPRTGAFEVSYKGMLVFSKLKGGYWPNCELVADKCLLVLQNDSEGKDVTQFLAGNSPMKGGGFGASAKKKETRGSRMSQNAPSAGQVQSF